MAPQKDERNHLPVLGVGPVYVIIIVILTTTCIVLSQMGVLPYLRIRATIAVFHTAGTIFFVAGIWLWVSAAIKERLQDNIIENKLITTGVYSVVRNPIYSAFSFVLTGVLLIYGNLYLFPLSLLYWALLTIMMRATEEKWLLEQFGDEYRDYCKRVNRCIPWLPKAK